MSSVLKTCFFLRNKLVNHCVYKHKFKRYYSDKVLPATEFISWNTATPVKLRLEDTIPGNYPPILVQTMLRNTVKNNGNKKAIVSHDGGINWTFTQYHEEVQKAAKGFISLGLNPMHGVGIMGHNHPNWNVARFV